MRPREEARRLLRHQPYITRLYTALSPHEMSADPVFGENPDLDDVDRLHVATITGCGDVPYVDLDDGRSLPVDRIGTSANEAAPRAPWWRSCERKARHSS